MAGNTAVRFLVGGELIEVDDVSPSKSVLNFLRENLRRRDQAIHVIPAVLPFGLTVGRDVRQNLHHPEGLREHRRFRGELPDGPPPRRPVRAA